MAEEKVLTKQEREYNEAFVYQRAGWGCSVFGAVVAAAGVLWSTYTFLNSQTNLAETPKFFAPALAIFGVLMCILGALQDIHQDLTQKQLQDEYHWKYGNSFPDGED